MRDVDKLVRKADSVVPVYDKITPGPTGVGAQYRELVRILPFWYAEVISEIVQFEPDYGLSYSFSFGQSMDGRLEYLLEPVDAGTRVIQRQSLWPRGMLKLFSPFIHLAFAQVAGRRLQTIKQILEAEC